MDATKVFEQSCEELRSAMLKNTAIDWKPTFKKTKGVFKKIEATLKNPEGVQDIEQTLKIYMKEVESLGLPEDMTDTLCSLLLSTIRTLTTFGLQNLSGEQSPSLLEVRIYFDATSRAITKVLGDL